MQEIEFTKEDEYCIRNFGYNTVGDYENLKQIEDKEHLIVEELEYRLQQKENIIKEVREYCNNDNNFEIITDFDTFENHNEIGIDILEILDKGSDEISK